VTRRVYSACLVARFISNGGERAEVVVPAGHHWVIKSLTWCDNPTNDWDLENYIFGAYAVFRSQPLGEYGHPILLDYKLKDTVPGEWEGRIVLTGGDSIVLQNLTLPADEIHPISVAVFGYDLLD
jgi:hypothetical protein